MELIWRIIIWEGANKIPRKWGETGRDTDEQPGRYRIDRAMLGTI